MPTDDDVTDPGAAPERIHPRKRGEARKWFHISFAKRERAMLERIRADMDLPFTTIIRMALRQLYASIYGAEAVRLPTRPLDPLDPSQDAGEDHAA